MYKDREMNAMKVIFWIIFGLAALGIVVTIAVQVYATLFAAQHPDQIGNWVKDILKPTIDVIKETK